MIRNQKINNVIWQTKKLGGVLNIQNGYAFDSKKFSLDAGVPLIRIRDLKNGIVTETNYLGDFDKKYEIKKGDFLIGMDGEFNCYEWKGGTALLNQRVCKLQNFDGLDSRFLFYGINKFLREIEDTTGFTTVKHISSSQISNILFSFPGLLEQKRIVKKLDAIFENIDKANENTEENLKNSKELFESYLNNIFSNYSDGWTQKPLGSISDLEYGFTDKAKESGDPRYIRITDIDEYGNLRADGKMYVKSSPQSERFLLTDNELLMARTGATFAKVLLYNNVEKSVFASYLIRIRFKENIDNKLYWYFSKSKIYWDQANKLSSGSAQPQFNGNALKQLVFSYPVSSKVQLEIVKKLDELSEQTKKLEENYKQKLVLLDELKKSVLTKAFAGEL